MGVKVILNRFVLGKLEGKGHLRRACEYGGKTVEWIVRNCIRVDFDCSYFGRALNDVLIKLYNEQ